MEEVALGVTAAGKPADVDGLQADRIVVPQPTGIAEYIET
jgi:hypothetical protein